MVKTKDEARQAARKERAIIKKEDGEKPQYAQANAHIVKLFERHILPHIDGMQDIVALTLPLGSELNLTPLKEFLWQRHIKLALPRVGADASPLIFHLHQKGDILINEKFGTKAPSPNAPMVTPTLFLVPFLAYDRQGYRLGYGGGFYDRTIEAYRQQMRPLCTIGVGYKGQEWQAVPHDHLDQKLDYILNEKELLPTNKIPFSPFLPAIQR